MSLGDVLVIAFGAQTRLAVWLPLAGFLARLILVRCCAVRSPKTRFWSLMAVLWLAPLVFLTLIPSFALMRTQTEADVRAWVAVHVLTQPSGVATDLSGWSLRLVLWPYLLIPLGMTCALAIGVLEYAVTAVRIWLLPKHREGLVFVLECPGLHAFSFGLIRPRVFVSKAVWVGPHCQAVLAHEFAHVARRDPLMLFWARAIRRSTLYLPFGGLLFNELHLEAERSCDQVGVRAVGGRRYAAALLAFAEAAPSRRSLAGPAAMAFGVPETALLLLLPMLQLWGSRLRSGLIVRRLEALLLPGDARERPVLFWFAFGLCYVLILGLI